MGKRTKFVTDGHPLVEDNRDKNPSNFLNGLDKEVVFDFLNKTQPKNPITNFRTERAREIYYLAKLGAKSSQIAEFFKVSESTVEAWKVSDPEFYEAYRQGTWMFSFEIMETLSKKALGYNYIEVEESQTVTRNGTVVPITKIVHKHQVPSDIALFFLLKGKHPDIWGDLSKIQTEGINQQEIAKRIDPEKFTDEEKELIRSIAIKKAKEIQGQSQ